MTFTVFALFKAAGFRCLLRLWTWIWSSGFSTFYARK